MNKIITSALLCAGFTVQAAELPNFALAAEKQQYWVTVGQDSTAELQAVGAKEFMTHSVANPNSKGISIAQLNGVQMNKLSRLMHVNKNRCGGYIVHDTLQSALVAQQQSAVADSFLNSALSQQAKIEALVPNLTASGIVDTINYLSTQFSTRYHTSSQGAAASLGLMNRWKALTDTQPWASVSQVSHNNTSQKSVEVVLTGSEAPDQIVVLGGHLDSTSSGSSAPGADDDASGIATLEEILRVYLADGTQPKRTVKIYGYAAEEVGLVGSGEIAASAASNGDNIVGVLQLDMTNYQGSAANDITFMTDYTSSTQNNYIKDILDTYFSASSTVDLGIISYGDSSCGYGCSDHASWHNRGFPASMPFETPMGQHNQRIHTPNDTLANMDTTGNKALKFAKMGLAYLIEMAADVSTPPPPPTDGVLEKGVPATGLSASTGSDLKFTFEVPAGATNGTITMSGGTGDADLYVKTGSAPTDSSYDCRPYASGNNESCNISGTGTAHVRAKAYSSFSGVSIVGDYTPGGGGGLPQIDESHTGLSVASGGWINYTQNLQAGYSSLVVTMSGGSGDADLYVNHGTKSTTSNYDCRPYRNGNSETCTMNSPAAGDWYIDVRGYSSASNFNLSWTTNE